jgi:uncharacterized protein YggE
MKISVFLAIAATIAAAALFAACGGNDASTGGSQTSQIKTQHGLAVAALAADFARSSSSTTNTTANSAAAPAAQTGQNGGPSSGGSAAADISKSAAGSSSLVAGAPQASTSNDTGITVQGYGMATADADSATVQFYFSSYNNIMPPGVPVPMPGANGSSGSTPSDLKPTAPSPGAVSPITQADLQPVVNALTNAGVAAGDIQFSGQGYYDMYSSSATLTATIKSLSIVDSAVTAAQSAAANLGNNITLQSTNVSYTLQDCKPLESAAMKAAVADAGERAGLLADALSVKLGNVTGASDNSFSPAGVPCSSSFIGPYPMPYGIAYDSIKSGGSSSSSVQVVAQISVTYAMQ